MSHPIAQPKHASDSAASDRPPDGKLGKYRLTAPLGRGGMGWVYRGEDTFLQRQVAIKLLSRSSDLDQKTLRRFVREARLAAKISHPNVVTVYDIDRWKRQFVYIVMELMAGGSVEKLLQKNGPFHWTDATRLMLDMCQGLVAAHSAGLIHRDIKPANIMLTRDGTVKLADFGLAKPVGRVSTSLTELDIALGTLSFMSPEQCRAESLDERTDIYSLGATYYALLTGRSPFQAETAIEVAFAHCSSPIPDPREFDADISEQCSTIIRNAMAKLARDRYQSVDEMIADLNRVQQQAPTDNDSSESENEEAWYWLVEDADSPSVTGTASRRPHGVVRNWLSAPSRWWRR